MLDYKNLSVDEIWKLSDAKDWYSKPTPLQIAYHCMLEAARHYICAVSEYEHVVLGHNINMFSVELRRSEIRSLRSQYNKALYDYLYILRSEKEALLNGLQCMVRCVDMSIVANESTLIKNTYDLVFNHGYASTIKRLLVELQDIDNAIRSTWSDQTPYIWQD